MMITTNMMCPDFWRNTYDIKTETADSLLL